MATPGSKWATDPRGPYIRMHSGEKFYLAYPTPDQFRLRDIAYHLARINRYTGASQLSVAQHCVVASWMAAEYYKLPLLPQRMLIHDVAEHAYGDVSSPLKSLLPCYKSYEMQADAAVETRFDLTFLDTPQVKEVDDRMWLTERLVVYRECGDISEDYSGPLEPFPLDSTQLEAWFAPWTPEAAEYEWLNAVLVQFPWIEL